MMFPSSAGPHATRVTFNCEQSHFSGQERGSGIAVYERTAEAAFGAEKLISISAMPVYKDKSHEELRWEDYNITAKGGLGLSSSAVNSTSTTTNFSTASPGTASVSSTSVKPNMFEKIFPSLVTETTSTWKYPGPTSSFTSQPLQFSPSAPSNSFNPFIPRTNLTSPASATSSVSFAPLNDNPFTIPSTSLATYTSSSSPTFSFTSQPFQFSPSASTCLTTVTSAPSNSFNPFSPRTNLTSPASATSSVSLAPLNNNPFTNPFSFTSQPHQFSPSASTCLTTVTSAPSNSFNPFSPRTNLTSPASATSSVSLAPLNNNPFTNPFSFTSQPHQFSPSASTCLTTVTSAPSNSFNPFSPRTNLTSPASATSSVSLAPLNNNPFTNPFSFTSQPHQFSPSASTCLTTVTSAPSNSFNPFMPTNLTSPASATSSVSLAPLNNDPFTNPSTSLATHSSSSIPTFSAFTSGVDFTPSSLNAFWSTPTVEPFTSTVTAPAKSVSVSPVSSGLSSTCNQPTTLFNYNSYVPSTPNFNGTTTRTVGQGSVSQLSSSQITSMEKPLSSANPFGTLPPKPHMLFDGSRATQSIQYGISSIPVKDKPAPAKYSLLTARHLSGRIKLPIRKYDPKLNAPKIPYFSDTKEIPVAAYVPRENPRALMVGPEKWPPSTTRENVHDEYENERDDPTKEKQLFTTILDVPSKLQQPDYYTQPEISELEAKERTEPGFCRRVKDFVVGRHGYGSIKFLGETDVRNVDIETLVQFNNREVIVYMDDSKKPPVGEGLNKPAEITLLNIKCFDKTTGMQHMGGSKINKYTEMLKKKAVVHGAEFMSYDPVEGKWEFRVQHF